MPYDPPVNPNRYGLFVSFEHLFRATDSRGTTVVDGESDNENDGDTITNGYIFDSANEMQLSSDQNHVNSTVDSSSQTEPGY